MQMLKVMSTKDWKKKREERKPWEECHDELGFIIAQKVAVDLFLLDAITLGEYQKIKEENIHNFNPYLGSIML